MFLFSPKNCIIHCFTIHLLQQNTFYICNSIRTLFISLSAVFPTKMETVPIASNQGIILNNVKPLPSQYRRAMNSRENNEAKNGAVAAEGDRIDSEGSICESCEKKREKRVSYIWYKVVSKATFFKEAYLPR